MGISFWVFCLAFCGILSIYLPFFTGSFISISGLDLRFSDVLFVLLCNMAFMDVTIKKKTIIRHASLTNSLAVFLLWIALSAFIIAPLYNTPIINGSLNQFRRFIYFPIFFLTLIIFHNTKQLKRFFIICVIYGFISSILTIVGSAYFLDRADFESSELSHAFLHSKVISQIIFFFCLGLITYETSRKKRIFLGLVLITSLFSILVGLSRGVIFTTAGGLILYSVLLKKKINNFLLIVVLSLITIIPFLFMEQVRDAVIERMKTGVNDLKVVALIIGGEDPRHFLAKAHLYGADFSLTRKVIEAIAIFNEFKKSPIWGLGIGYQYEKYEMSREGDYKTTSYAHSVYNYFLMNTGLIGFFIFLRLLFKIGKLFYHLFSISDDPSFRGVFFGCFLSFIAVCINSLNGSFLLDIPIIAFFAVFAAIGEIIRQKNPETNHNFRPRDFVVAKTR